ncbi:MAG TPA: hypothetical protein VNE58_10565 [Casimicrobiaceae bacterium]|nr:hypothetical protein [Casimicrobiaceae bacterium]
MNAQRRAKRCRRHDASQQCGGFLLEAMVGILIFTLGVLGLVALQGRAIAYQSDAVYRGEAAYLANAYVSRMWADSHANLPLLYALPGQPQYEILKAQVDLLPGATLIPGNPQVTITQTAPGGVLVDPITGITLTQSGTLVNVIISWRPPKREKEGSAGNIDHNYEMTTIIAHNQ